MMIKIPKSSELMVGIIGGCLSHQAGIPKSKLYHQVLAGILGNRYSMRLKLKLARDFEEAYCKRLKRILEDGPVDMIIIHVRNQFLKQSLFICTEETEQYVRRFINPLLFNWLPWLSSWDGTIRYRVLPSHPGNASNHPQRGDNENIGNRIRIGRLRLRELNFLMADWLGITRTVVRQEQSEIAKAVTICNRFGIPIIVMGPTLVRDTMLHENRLCREMTRHIESCLKGCVDVEFCDLANIENINTSAALLDDGLHMSEDGHAKVANSLMVSVNRLLESQVR